MGAIENISKIGTESQIIYDEIKKFLQFSGMKSRHTYVAYKNDLIKFFGKPLETITKEDLEINKSDIEDFIEEMFFEEQLKGQTIKRCLRTVKQLIDELKENLKSKGIFIETDINLKILKKIPEIKQSYGIFTPDEVWTFANYLRVKPKVRQREEKYYLVLFAMDTSFRKSALRNLKWSNFIDTGGETIRVQVIDKRNEKYIADISREFYNELLSIKRESEYVFPISNDSIQNMMNKCKEWLNIPEDRFIVFHSIRKTGITFKYRLTNDIMVAKRAANHKSITTTQLYVEPMEINVLGAVSSKSNIDNELYKKVSHEDLIKAIEGLNGDQKLYLNMKLNEIINNK